MEDATSNIDKAILKLSSDKILNIKESNINENKKNLVNINKKFQNCNRNPNQCNKNLLSKNFNNTFYILKRNETADHKKGRPTIIIGNHKYISDSILILPGSTKYHYYESSTIIFELQFESSKKITYFYSNAIRWTKINNIGGKWSTKQKLVLNQIEKIINCLQQAHITNLKIASKSLNKIVKK